MRNINVLLLASLLLPLAAACGEDESAPPPPPPAPGGAPPPAPGRPGGAAAAPGAQLQPRLQIEQKIVCAEPEKATGPTCTPDASTCEPGLYCIKVGGGFNCEPCPERDTIRHEFKDRDFIADQVRDPFQSYVIVPTELVEKSEKKVEGPCTRAEQFIASNYSYMDLRLVGIVSQGTQRKVLMMDRGNLGHIIRRGDCVGKEKAVVKDIGTGYVTFVVTPDPDARLPTGNQPEEYSVQLHPKSVDVTQAPPDMGTQGTTSAPIVAPPGAPDPTVPPPPAAQGQGAPPPAANQPTVPQTKPAPAPQK